MPRHTSTPQKKQPQVDESKRRDLKRVALLVGAIALGPTLVACFGCQTTSGRERSKTVDDFLSEKKPQW